MIGKTIEEVPLRANLNGNESVPFQEGSAYGHFKTSQLLHLKLTISTDVPDLSYNEADPQTISDQMGQSVEDVLSAGAVRFEDGESNKYYKVIGYYGAEGGYITFIGVDNIYQYDVNASGYITDTKVTSIAPDDNLSDTSENAVQNKVVKAAFEVMEEAKQDVLTFDDVPTENSNNPVKSGGVKTALNELGQEVTIINVITQVDGIEGATSFDSSLWIVNTPFSESKQITKVKLLGDVSSISGSIQIGTFIKEGNNFTTIESGVISLVANQDEYELSLNIRTGDYLGFRQDYVNVLKFTTGSGTSGFYYKGSVNITPGTTYTCSALTSLKAQFPFSLLYETVTPVNQVAEQLVEDVEQLEENVSAIEQVIGELITPPLCESDIVVLGDSITWLGGDDCNGRDNPSKGWTTYFKEKAKPRSIRSYALSGATWSHTANTQYDITHFPSGLADNNVIYNQINRLINDISNNNQVVPDLIIIAAGINDVLFPNDRPDALSKTAEQVFATASGYITTPIGQITSVAEAVRFDIELIKQNIPETQIIIMSPLQSVGVTLDKCREIGGIIEGCSGYLSSSCVRQDKECGVYRSQESVSHFYLYDGTHTNADGAKAIGYYLAEKISGITRYSLK